MKIMYRGCLYESTSSNIELLNYLKTNHVRDLKLISDRLIPPTMLVHFSENAELIRNHGFKYGVTDLNTLAYSDTRSSINRTPGYNYAYRAVDVIAGKFDNGWTSEEYNDAVVFVSAGVSVFHSTDNEAQIIFDGSLVKSFVYIQQSYSESDYDGWAVMGVDYVPFKVFASINSAVHWLYTVGYRNHASDIIVTI